MIMKGSGYVVRPWRPGDEAALVRHANSRAVWRNMLSGFPHPYRMEDAVWWIRETQSFRAPIEHFAIEIAGEAAGGIGLKRLDDSVFVRTREFGYWLGEAHWGKGLMTRVVGTFTHYAFDAFSLARLEAGVFAWNPASGRVLEKNGFTREATMRARVYKDNHLVDQWLYARLRQES